MSEHQFLTTTEAAKMLKLSRRQILNLINNKTLRATRISPRVYRVYSESVSELIEQGKNV